MERLADPYAGTTLFHGPVLRVIRNAGVGGSGADATIDGGAVVGNHVPVGGVDGLLQLALLWARRAGAGDTLPMAVDEVRVHRWGAADGGAAQGVVRGVRADATGAVCDAALLDPDGTPRVELLGIQLVRRPGS